MLDPRSPTLPRRFRARILRTAVAWAAPAFASVAWAAEIPRNEAETLRLFQRIEANVRANPVWTNARINARRDGRRSAYLEDDPGLPEQAAPVPAETLAAIPEARLVPYPVFARAIRGLRAILRNFPDAGIRRDVLTIVDFDQKTEGRRFYVFDLAARKLRFQTWTNHGANSDADRDRRPETFSNEVDSYRSSLGFMLTARSPYVGNFGHSLRLHGIDGDLNSRLHPRAIVLHPWPSLHPRGAAALDPFDTTLGCLSLPWYESGKFYGLRDQPLAKLIIDAIRGRSVVFVSAAAFDLERESRYLAPPARLPAAERREILARLAREASLHPTGNETSRLPAGYADWADGRRPGGASVNFPTLE